MSREVAASSTRLCTTPLPITLGAPWEGRKSVAVMTALREEAASLVAKVEIGNGRRRAILLPDDPRRPPQDRRGEEADNPPMEETRVVATLMLATGDEVVGHPDAVEAEVVTRTTMVQAEEEADGEEGTPAEESEAEDPPEAILSLAPVWANPTRTAKQGTTSSTASRRRSTCQICLRGTDATSSPTSAASLGRRRLEK